jgi:hypothetical protein
MKVRWTRPSGVMLPSIVDPCGCEPGPGSGAWEITIARVPRHVTAWRGTGA